MRLWRERVDLVDEVAGGGGDAAEHAHDEAELIGRVEDSLVDERASVADVAGVEALELGADVRLVHRFQEEADVFEGVGEDVVVDELLSPF